MDECIKRDDVYEFAKDQLVKETGAYSKGLNAGLKIMMAAARNKDAIASADVRPCEYCASRKTIEDEYGEFEGKIVKITPLPAIDLTTGETEPVANPPYYALFISYDWDEGEKGSFPIKFCPICGRDLVEGSV